jgi:hypothetical protein
MAAILMALSGCGDDPFAFDWVDTPDTVVLYSLARPELNLASGWDFFRGNAIRIEAPNASGSWDVALDTQNGELVLLPPGALGVESRARIAPLSGIQFDDVREAPSDSTAYISRAPVPMALGTTYVIRTDQSVGAFGTRCVYYARMEPLELDVAGGTMTFREVTNPVCNDRDLVPPN